MRAAFLRLIRGTGGGGRSLGVTNSVGTLEQVAGLIDHPDEVVHGVILEPPVWSMRSPIPLEILPDRRTLVVMPIVKRVNWLVRYQVGWSFCESGEEAFRLVQEWGLAHSWRVLRDILCPSYSIEEKGVSLGNISHQRSWWNPDLWVSGRELPTEWRSDARGTYVTGPGFTVALRLAGRSEFWVLRREITLPAIGFAFFIWWCWRTAG